MINEGKVQQVADPPTLYERPNNRFVADFIGQTNVFSGTVEAVDHPFILLMMDLNTCSLMLIGHGVEREKKTAVTVFEEARRALMYQALKRGLHEVAEFDIREAHFESSPWHAL